MKKFILAFIAAYIFIFLWGWLLNGVFLKDVYAETPNLWRTQSEMLSLFHWIIIGQALIVFSFVMIYVSGFAGRRSDRRDPAWYFVRNRSYRNARGLLRSATDSREIDLLRKPERIDRDDPRGSDGWGNLQTRADANGASILESGPKVRSRSTLGTAPFWGAHAVTWLSRANRSSRTTSSG